MARISGGGGTSCTVINTREPSGDVCGPETVAACNSSAAVWEATAAGMFDVGTQLAAGPDAMGAVIGGKCASTRLQPAVRRSYDARYDITRMRTIASLNF